MFTGIANAHEFEVDGIYYNITSTSTSERTVEVTCKGSSYSSYSNEYTGDISIPESVEYNSKTYAVTSIGYETFRQCTSLTSITIPSSVTDIGDYAFLRCEKLASVDIPNSVTNIGEGTFMYCYELASITIPNSVTSIGKKVFELCKALKSIDIPNSVTSIGRYAFYNCTSLETVTIPNSVTSIGDYAFYYCSSLKDVTIPDDITSIGSYTFYYCTSLENITIPNSVTSVGSYGFYNCTALTSLTCLATTPPTCESNAFSNIDKESCILYVPVGTKATYEITLRWEDFLNIVEIEVEESDTEGTNDEEVDAPVTEEVATYISSLTSDSEVAEVGRYNLSGQLLQGEQPGINIIRMSDGSIKKVLVK